MKKLLVVAVAVVMVMGLAGSAMAQQHSLKAGATAINVGMGNSLTGDIGVTRILAKYNIGTDMALLAGLGLQTTSGDFDADFFGLTFGVRKYLKVDTLAPFFEGRFSYETIKVNAPGFDPLNVDIIDLSFGFGAEVFLHKQFSLEGSVGLGFGMMEDNNNLDVTYIGTRTVGVNANFYF